MALSEPRVLSLPHRIWFAGWHSTLPALQQAGWELSAEQDFNWLSVRIAMRHRDFGLHAVTEKVDCRFFDRHEYGRTFDFRVVFMANDLKIQIMNDNFSAFSPIDAMPQFLNTEIKSIEDFGIFATPLARTEEIIVEPETVMSMLEKIKSMQSPEQAAIRERNRSRERRQGEPIQRQQFHAQILSIAA